MIEIEKLIKALEQHCDTEADCNSCPYEPEETSIKCRDSLLCDCLEVLKEQPQWISVKDRLPDDASDVLAYYDDGTESRIIPVNYYKRRWYDCVFNRSIDDLETGFIGYWMSLPEPPQEGVKREWLIGRKS